MKSNIYYKNKEIQIIVTNLCSYGDHGDYELFPSEPLDFTMGFVVDGIKKEGFRLKAVTDRMLLFNFNTIEITLYRSGRMILENIQPDRYEIAMSVGQKIILMTEDN